MYESNSVSGGRTPIFRFNNPINLKKGQLVTIQSILERDNVWFHHLDV